MKVLGASLYLDENVFAASLATFLANLGDREAGYNPDTDTITCQLIPDPKTWCVERAEKKDSD